MRKIYSVLASILMTLINSLRTFVGWLLGPSISGFQPVTAYPGSIIEILGNNFSTLRENNEVTIGGVAARVIEASANMLKVISSYKTPTGKIKVATGGQSTISLWDFNSKPYPIPGSSEDGPPLLLEGTGFPSSGDVPPTGDLKILVVLVNPTDRVPANADDARTDVVNKWASVTTFYNQATYNALNLKVSVTDDWHTLWGTRDDYVDGGIQNIRPEMTHQLMAESARHAVLEGFNINDFQMIACVINLDGEFIRALGGISTSLFHYWDPGTLPTLPTPDNPEGSPGIPPKLIFIPTLDPINELWIQESADWGRFAHETGHNIVAAPSGVSALSGFGSNTLGEDIYDGDLADGSIASAQNFDMMGSHDDHPIFSAYHLERAGWISGTNILNLQWDRNPFSDTFEVVAHGLNQNTYAGRYHIIKIKVTDGLFYYVEVRQRPPADSAQIFDDNIPLDAATHSGGVIVTKVFTGLVNNNQQMRFITLLHDPHVLSVNQISVDPARSFKITVLNDNVASDPLVCSIRIEWAQALADDPSGQFDLRIDPWDTNCQTPDIWIDRNPFGAFDRPRDADGRPQGNGDKPRPQEKNKFFTRIHNDGIIPATNVEVTFYAVDPPGVGDNGNWSPLTTRIIASINNNDNMDIFADWVPIVGEHTCLKVYIQQQLGEITGGNNSAQENVFDFEAPASSVPQAVYIPVAVRNPLKIRTMVHLAVFGVKLGYIVQFPNSWIWLEALEERKLTLTVVPVLDYPLYKQMIKGFEETVDYSANINLTGYILKEYKEGFTATEFPASKFVKIGGIFSKVKPKKKCELNIWQDKEQRSKLSVGIAGKLSSSIAGQNIRVDVTSPLIETKYSTVKTDSNGYFVTRIGFEKDYLKALNDGVVQSEKQFVSEVKALAQAFVIDANEVADASSNFIRLIFY